MRYLPLIFFYLPLILGQFVPLILLAAGMGLLFRRRLGWAKPFLVTLAVLMLLLTVNLFHPVLICPAEFQPYLTDELRDGIYGYFAGPGDLPMIPLYFKVIDGREGYIEVKKHWLYGGSERFAVSMDEYGNAVPDMLG